MRVKMNAGEDMLFVVVVTPVPRHAGVGDIF
jgi:hypothetical protein